MKYIIATDVGSTTTKARFFKKIKGEWRYVTSGEAPTTVEAPYENVTLGVRNAVREVEELTGHRILSKDGSGIVIPCDGEIGVDLYCTTSSAGGGLQMMVTGVVKAMTAESANRAALGAGAIVMDVMAIDDGRKNYQKIQRIRSIRPDMILLAGGTDGGATAHVMRIVELIQTAEPKPRLGIDYLLPIVYAGNKDIRTQVKKMMNESFALTIVDNIRPTLEEENTEPGRRAIHELFMEHVMSHAPGYNELTKWTDVDIMPTPAAEGIAMQLIAEVSKVNVIGVGLGGATTNVYSIVDGRFVRSVSANLGMSYSICNVLKEAEIENILRWIPFGIDEIDLENRLYNKMIRPTTLPQSLEDLIVEHAVAREALRLGLKHHKTIATRLKGVKIDRDTGYIFDQALEETYIHMRDFRIIVGTGGLLSHAPRRIQSLILLTDAFQPEGVTSMIQDSVFMMPHLGILSTVNREAAWNIFDKDCIVRLGTVIAPVGEAEASKEVMEVALKMPDGSSVKEKMKFGEIKKIPLKEGEIAKAIISPHKGFDIGLGPGKRLETKIHGGVVGIVIDVRGRPLKLPEGKQERDKKLLEWIYSIDMYPKNQIEKLKER